MASEWKEYPKEKPEHDEPILIAMLTKGVSVVQFAKFLVTGENTHEWQLFDASDVGTITHWLRIPPLPAIHNTGFMGHA